MSRFHDDTTSASNPVALRLSDSKLRRLCPQLYGFWGLFPSARMWRARMAEHLPFGDSRAAVVVQPQPLLVAAYTDELDCAVLLKFPDWLAAEHQLEPGHRLLTINIYGAGDAVAPDLTPGPAAGPNWKNFYPLIADFVSDDSELIAARKQAISEKEWERVRQCGQELLRRQQVPRPGNPTLSWKPVVGSDT